MRLPPKRLAVGAGALLLAAFIGIQFLPAERTNPLGTGDPPAPREVMWTLRRACYDCHSNETRWPIWAYVAPISWQVIADVSKARSVMNFSNWASYTPEEQKAHRVMVNWTTTAHRMPGWYYITLHPDAKLSASDMATLTAWSKGDSTK